MSLIKNMVDRIEAQNTKGFTIKRKKRRKPALSVSEKLTQPQQSDQTELKQQKKIEQKKHKQKMKSESTNANKTIKDGQKAGTPPKCIFSYTEQEWPDRQCRQSKS